MRLRTSNNYICKLGLFGNTIDGYLLSKKAFETLSLEEYQKEMQGIYSTCINTLTLDESPMAYKKIDDIVYQIQDTVDIIDTLKPIYHFKAADTPKWKRK